MKILLIADVHNRPKSSSLAHKITLSTLSRVIKNTECDLIVFLGDIVHGPDFQTVDDSYEKYLRQVLDLTHGKKFATVFGNHDDECDITKNEILQIISTYPNSITKGCNYVYEKDDEVLLFIDSGNYYDGDESLYATVPQETIDWAVNELKGRCKKAIMFQHIIVPDIIACLDEYPRFKPFCVYGGGTWVKFKKGIHYKGFLGERPCPPDISTGQLEQLSPYLKAAVFGHDHINNFEITIDGVKLIQCPGCGSNCYDKHYPSSVKLLDTKTLKSKDIYLTL